ncbi:methylated-DNA--[protein]-cysteine S-methyltransferase [Brevundimonas sp. VNH65]|uniref:methylated-DNA--[protein]-cysteine S-methyltransferase n=1 Tax=Brevundimonas sp. VNH65 TaxID=3400917 RepID=UPI003C0ECD5D
MTRPLEAQFDLTLSRLTSPIGEILLAADADGAVRALDFHDYEPRMLRLLGRRYPRFALTAGAAPVGVAASLDAYFNGDANALDALRVETAGTDFQRSVWQALRTIPAGQTWTYGRLAQAIGRPSAMRAVGLANGANPVALIVPCHRVIGANGALTGYAGGMERKAWLLAHEARRHAAGLAA